MVSTLTGDADDVDIALVNSLKAVIQQYHAAVEGWTLPEEVAKENLNSLKSRAMSIWTAAHEVNSAKHIIRQHALRQQALPPVQFYYHNRHDTPSFERTEVMENMEEKYPQFFSDEALRNAISIEADFKSTTGGNGRLVLQGENKEYSICQEAHSHRKGQPWVFSFVQPCVQNAARSNIWMGI